MAWCSFYWFGQIASIMCCNKKYRYFNFCLTFLSFYYILETIQKPPDNNWIRSRPSSNLSFIIFWHRTLVSIGTERILPFLTFFSFRIFYAHLFILIYFPFLSLQSKICRTIRNSQRFKISMSCIIICNRPDQKCRHASGNVARMAIGRISIQFVGHISTINPSRWRPNWRIATTWICWRNGMVLISPSTRNEDVSWWTINTFN